MPELELISVTTDDGASFSINGAVSHSSPKAVILISSAMGVPGSFYQPFANVLAEHGYAAMTWDLRGIGSSSVRASRQVNFGYYEMLTRDWPAVMNAVANRFPGLPIVLLGHSLGGQLNTLYASLYPDQINGLVLIASGTVYWKGWPWPANVGLWIATRLVKWIAWTLGFFPGKRIGFGGNEARNVMMDWANNAATGIYRIRNCDHDFEDLLGKLNIPVLAISLDGDKLAPQGSVDNLCAKLSGCLVTQKHMTTEELSPKSLDHFRWVHYGQELVPFIDEWWEKWDQEKGDQEL